LKNIFKKEEICIVLSTGLGSASHLGVCLGLPCIGVAKKLFHVDGLEKDAEHGRKVCYWITVKFHY